MAHHGYFDDEHMKRQRALADEFLKNIPTPSFEESIAFTQPKTLGATGRYPLGKLDKSDQGEIAMGITNYEGKVILNLGEKMGWVGFTPEQARDLADTLKRQADAAARDGK